MDSRRAPVENQRLLLTPYTAADLEPLFAIHSDPRVGRYTCSPSDREEAARRYETNESQRDLCGAAPWVARRRSDRIDQPRSREWWASR